MKCERCQTEAATLMATCIINGTVTKRSLCRACYDAEDLAEPFAQSLLPKVLPEAPIAKIELKLVKSHVDSELPLDSEVEEETFCPDCGLSRSEFQKQNLVGCPTDYEFFAKDLDQLLLRMHGDREHRGRTPLDVEMSRIRAQRVKQLNDDLKRAITSEAFEEAARLRDRIRALEDASLDLDS